MIRKQLKQIDCWNNGYPKGYGFVYEIYKGRKNRPSWTQEPSGVLVFYLIPFDYLIRFVRYRWLHIRILWREELQEFLRDSCENREKALKEIRKGRKDITTKNWRKKLIDIYNKGM